MSGPEEINRDKNHLSNKYSEGTLSDTPEALRTDVPPFGENVQSKTQDV
jgi:hypothetical protein